MRVTYVILSEAKDLCRSGPDLDSWTVDITRQTFVLAASLSRIGQG